MLKRKLKEPFGKAGLTVAILALVMALVGGAYAAGGLTKSQEKQVKKIAKKYAGKPGAPGAPGTAGTNGTNGTNGKDGTRGENGTNGKSVVVSGTAAGCGAGGSTVEVEGEPATQQEVCNGEDGQTGFTETLPSEKTETGSWAFKGNPEGNIFLPISFNIPLASSIEASKVHYVTLTEQTGEEVPLGCQSGGVEGSGAKPLAEAGNFCVYEVFATNASFGAILKSNGPPSVGASETGALLTMNSSGTPTFAYGTWAVTAGP
jgi:hypothetical protein